MTLTIIQMLTALLALLGAVWVLLYHLEANGRLSPSRTRDILLVVLVLFSIACYFDFGQYPKHGRFMNPHGWFHYYLGAKYLRDNGYHDFYRAVVVANADNNGKLINPRMRNLETYAREDPAAVLRDADRYRFTPQRWAEFKHDVAYFQSIFIPRRWPGVVLDKGFNATPVWSMVGGTLAALVPTQNRTGMVLLLALDILLVLLAAGVIWRTFGWRAAALVLIYLGTHFAFFMYNVNEIRGAFLRLDWIAALLIAVCLLRLKWYKTAGALVAYAALSRVFPLIFVFGLGAKLLWDLIEHRRLTPGYVRFFAAFVAVCAALTAMSVLWSGGLGLWSDFIEKLRLHDQGLSSQRTGFRYIFLGTFSGGGDKSGLLHTRRVLWWSIQAAVLAAAFVGVRRLSDHQALAFGYLPMFFLTAPTAYYQIALVMPLLFFLPEVRNYARALGAALLFLITTGLCFLNIAQFAHGDWSRSYVISWILLAFVAYMTAVALLTRPAPPVAQNGLESA
jgi:hypothetical protein